MYRKTMHLIVTLVVITLIACQKDPEIAISVDSPTVATATFNDVDQRLWTYFQRFEAEAQKRGRTIDLNNLDLIGNIEEIEQQHVAGQCNYSSNNPNEVIIDETFFEESSDLIIEFILFHELGHCVLGRDHREDAHTNGTCKSIMRSGLGECRDNYGTNSRDAYLDELFDPDSQ